MPSRTLIKDNLPTIVRPERKNRGISQNKHYWYKDVITTVAAFPTRQKYLLPPSLATPLAAAPTPEPWRALPERSD